MVKPPNRYNPSYHTQHSKGPIAQLSKSIFRIFFLPCWYGHAHSILLHTSYYTTQIISTLFFFFFYHTYNLLNPLHDSQFKNHPQFTSQNHILFKKRKTQKIKNHPKLSKSEIYTKTTKIRSTRWFWEKGRRRKYQRNDGPHESIESGSVSSFFEQVSPPKSLHCVPYGTFSCFVPCPEIQNQNFVNSSRKRTERKREKQGIRWLLDWVSYILEIFLVEFQGRERGEEGFWSWERRKEEEN